jgi:D-alanine-D-alanine ligase
MTQRTRDQVGAYGRVAVLMGGWSDEREVSLASGAAVLAALLRSGVDAVGIDLTPEIARGLDWSLYDRVFIVLHGLGGEDGTLQGCLEIAGVPYTGSGVLGSALGMDKLACKRVWAGMQLPIPPYRIMAKDTPAEAVAEALGIPLAVKPARGGSSLALTRVTHVDQIPEAYARAAAQGQGAVLAEQWIQGREFTVGILANEPLPVIEIQPPGEFYDYAAKYHSDATRYLCPPPISRAEQLEIQSLAISAFASIDAEGWGRVDLLRDEHGDLYLVEVNTVPGMTSHSLVPKAAAQAGIDFDTLCLRILDTCMPSVREASR